MRAVDLRSSLGEDAAAKIRWIETALREIELASHEDVITAEDLSNRGVAYATKAAVEAARVPSVALFIRTAGYYAAGDGGGALYKRVSSAPSHPGKIQSLDGAWWEYVGEEIDLRALGAYSDGAHATEDTAAGNSARLMVAAGKINKIILPRNAVTLSNDANAWAFASGTVEIVGDRTSILKAADGAGIGALIEPYGTAKVTLRGFTLDGNRDNGGLSTTLSAAIVNFSDNLVLEDMELKHCALFGVSFFQPSPGVNAQKATFSHCHFHDIGVIADRTVSSGNPRGNIGQGIFGDIDYLTVEHCVFENHYPLVGPIGDSTAINVNGRGNKIVNSTFVDCLNIGGGMIAVSDGVTGSTDINAIVSRNYLRQNRRFQDIVPSSSNNDATDGVEVNGSVALVSDNIMYNMASAGVITDAMSHHVSVLDNKIVGTLTSAQVGVAIPSTCYELFISGNDLRDLPLGVDYFGTGRVVLATNTLSGVTTTASGTSVIKYGNVGGDNFMVVAGLPSASANPGLQLQVNDANATTRRSIVANGGSNKVSVMSDGTNWLIV
jgi:hypothetical protein